MSTLRIRRRHTIYTLQPAAYCKFTGELVVDDVGLVARTPQSRVLRGKLRLPPGCEGALGDFGTGDERVIEVALKMVVSWYYESRMRDEAEKYDQLHELQGTVVPRVYGLFQGTTTDGFVTCLVMDFVGPPSNTKLIHAPTDFSLRALEKLIQLHDAGWTHGAVREEHVVFPDSSNLKARYHDSRGTADQDGPLLISLSHARPHLCLRSLPIIESTLRPAREAFGCDELYNVAAGMGIWNPGEIAFFSLPVPLSRAMSPEQLAREAPLRMQSTASGWAEALRHAKKVLAAHQARYGPIEYPDSDTDSDDGNAAYGVCDRVSNSS